MSGFSIDIHMLWNELRVPREYKIEENKQYDFLFTIIPYIM